MLDVKRGHEQRWIGIELDTVTGGVGTEGCDLGVKGVASLWEAGKERVGYPGWWEVGIWGLHFPPPPPRCLCHVTHNSA